MSKTALHSVSQAHRPARQGQLTAMGPVVLDRPGRKSLRFMGRAVCRTDASGVKAPPDGADHGARDGDEIVLWERLDGRWAVSCRIGGVENAAVLRTLGAAGGWAESLCDGAVEPSACPEDAVDLLAHLDERLAGRLYRERICRLVGTALSHWPRSGGAAAKQPGNLEKTTTEAGSLGPLDAPTSEEE